MPPISTDCRDGRCGECTGYTGMINEQCGCKKCHPPGSDLHDCSGRVCWCDGSLGGAA